MCRSITLASSSTTLPTSRLAMPVVVEMSARICDLFRGDAMDDDFLATVRFLFVGVVGEQAGTRATMCGLRVGVRTAALDLRRMSDNRDTQNNAEERCAALTLSTHMTEDFRRYKSRQYENPLFDAISRTRCQNSAWFGGLPRSVAIARSLRAYYD